MVAVRAGLGARLAGPLVLCVAMLPGMVRAEGLLALPTLGGVWMWSDEVIYHDWRIQKHAVTGHYRLIDARARRRQAGDFESCLAALERAKVAEAIPPLPQDVVVVLHGLGANRAVMARLCKALREEGKFHVVNVTYPSTMLSIDDYARSLESVIRHLAGVERVSFVAHSMGNIVVRKYLRNMETLDPALRPAVEYGRMVMIAPPNHGAEMADHLTDSALERELAELLVGEPARQLARSQGWPALERQLATPGFPFGIIAGGKGDAEGFLDAIPGDDDGLLSVESARLAGAADFVQVVSGIHQFMPQYDATRAATLSFLGRGYFTTQGEAQPIAAVR